MIGDGVSVMFVCMYVKPSINDGLVDVVEQSSSASGIYNRGIIYKEGRGGGLPPPLDLRACSGVSLSTRITRTTVFA